MKKQDKISVSIYLLSGIAVLFSLILPWFSWEGGASTCFGVDIMANEMDLGGNWVSPTGPVLVLAGSSMMILYSIIFIVKLRNYVDIYHNFRIVRILAMIFPVLALIGVLLSVIDAGEYSNQSVTHRYRVLDFVDLGIWVIIWASAVGLVISIFSLTNSRDR